MKVWNPKAVINVRSMIRRNAVGSDANVPRTSRLSSICKSLALCPCIGPADEHGVSPWFIAYGQSN
jgi:hypothetical protein